MRIGDGPTKSAVPISALAAALTYGSMFSVFKEPVTLVIFNLEHKQQILLTKRLWFLDHLTLYLFLYFSVSLVCFLFSQVVGVQRDSCCRTVTVCQWQSVAVVSHQAMGRWSSDPKRSLLWIVTTGEKSFVWIVIFWKWKVKITIIWVCRKKVCSNWSATLVQDVWQPETTIVQTFRIYGLFRSVILASTNQIPYFSSKHEIQFFYLISLCAVCAWMALWCAPSFPARFMSPGAHGAPAQLPVGMARGQEHASARKQRAALPVLPPCRQRAVTCQHVQVWDGAQAEMQTKCSSLFRLTQSHRIKS